MRDLTTPLATFHAPSSRRDLLKAGGLTVTLGALVAACGTNRGGSDEAGRVGNAPETTTLPTYSVDDAVLLRTASSLEYTAIDVYEQAIGAGLVPDEIAPAAAIFLANHQQIADQMGELTADVGGEAWTCANPWMMDRLVGPVLAAITTPRVIDLGEETFESELTEEQQIADVLNFAEALENLAVAAHQTLVGLTGHGPARIAHAEAASIEARQAAELAIEIAGADAYVSYDLLGTEPPEGAPRQFAIPSRFGQTSQIEIKAGPPDQNGVIEGFTLQTPAENSFVYNELSCDA
ncbi:MAG: hypothetical protein AAFP84_14270 [Actinomycetota bacterium]